MSTQTPDRVTGSVDLAVGGMTCASCVARVEKKLNKLDGVEATVNLPLESAHVKIQSPTAPADLIKAVEAAGYTATVTDIESDAPATAGSGAPARATATPADMADMDHSGHDMDGMSEEEIALSGHSMAPGHHMVEGEDSSAPTKDRGQILRPRMITSLIIAVPVVLISMIPPLQFPGWQWVVAPLALIVAVYGAWPFHTAAFRAARHGSSTMDTLVSLGVIVAIAWSLWALLFGGAGEIGMRMSFTLLPASDSEHQVPELYFEVATVVTTFLLIGRYAEWRSRTKAGDALRSLLDLGAKDVAVLRDGPDGKQHESRIPIDELRVSDLFVVRPGEKIATDGTIVEGTSAIDTSLLTGEPIPVDAGPGDDVTGATINTSGHLVVRATRIGSDTRLAQIGKLVSRAQTGKAPVQRLADQISAVFVPVVIGLALLTLAVWLLTGHGVQQAFTAAVAVLIIACPCALGLATPTALLVGTGRGAQKGILIKGPEILESTRDVDSIVLDKTGTVTRGVMTLAQTLAFGTDQQTVLDVTAAVEKRSEHPIAQAIATAAGADSDPYRVENFEAGAGRGVTGNVRGPGFGDVESHEVMVGRPAWLTSQGVAVSSEVLSSHDAAEAEGATSVVTAWDGVARGVLVLRDEPKETSAHAIAELKDLGLNPLLLTGDAEGPARAIAAQVGIAEVIAGVMPEDKVDVVTRLQKEGHRVAMVGDGVNDAAALAQADLGLSMGSGTDVAIEASDITLVRSDLEAAPQAIRLSRATLRIIKQNLFWAFAYNVAAIPLAGFGLLNPMIAGATMAASSIIVVSNSLRLRTFN